MEKHLIVALVVLPKTVLAGFYDGAEFARSLLHRCLRDRRLLLGLLRNLDDLHRVAFGLV